jgi:putative transposase
MDVRGRLHDEGAKGGDLVGPSPVDRGRCGTKKHVLIDGNGIPLSLLLSGANEPDLCALEQLLDEVIMRDAEGGPRRPKHLLLDKGYDAKTIREAIRARGIRGHIRRRGEKPLLGLVRNKPRRWKVERTGAWLANFRGLKVRWEVLGHVHIALCSLACAAIVFTKIWSAS